MADPAQGIKYIDDDDDEEINALQFKLKDAHVESIATELAEKVGTQLHLCIVLVCMLPVLGLLIGLAWRHYGARIGALQLSERERRALERESKKAS